MGPNRMMRAELGKVLGIYFKAFGVYQGLLE